MKYLQSAKRQFENVVEIVFMLVDVSGSMYLDDYSPSRLEGAIQANKKFIETKARSHPEDRVGVIGFDGSAHLLCPPLPVGEGSERLHQSFDRMGGFSGGTNFTSALKLASKQLFNNCPSSVVGARTEVSKFLRGIFTEPLPQEIEPLEITQTDKAINRRVIMLTDGQHTRSSDPVRIAAHLKDSGVTIECIGIAGSPERVDEAMLKKIASIDGNGNPRYYFIKDTSELVRKYESMSHHLRIM